MVSSDDSDDDSLIIRKPVTVKKNKTFNLTEDAVLVVKLPKVKSEAAKSTTLSKVKGKRKARFESTKVGSMSPVENSIPSAADNLNGSNMLFVSTPKVKKRLARGVPYSTPGTSRRLLLSTPKFGRKGGKAVTGTAKVSKLKDMEATVEKKTKRTVKETTKNKAKAAMEETTKTKLEAAVEDTTKSKSKAAMEDTTKGKSKAAMEDTTKGKSKAAMEDTTKGKSKAAMEDTKRAKSKAAMEEAKKAKLKAAMEEAKKAKLKAAMEEFKKAQSKAAMEETTKTKAKGTMKVTTKTKTKATSPAITETKAKTTMKKTAETKTTKKAGYGKDSNTIPGTSSMKTVKKNTMAGNKIQKAKTVVTGKQTTGKLIDDVYEAISTVGIPRIGASSQAIKSYIYNKRQDLNKNDNYKQMLHRRINLLLREALENGEITRPARSKIPVDTVSATGRFILPHKGHKAKNGEVGQSAN